MTPTHPRSALGRLVPQGPEAFAERVWGRGPLLVRAQERSDDTFTDLFGLAAADELLTHRGLRTPFLRMARQGTTLPDSDFTSPGGVGAGIADQVDPDKVRRLFGAGTSIVLQALHRTWPPMTRFAQDLAADLGHPTQVNCYITPADSQGFDAHYDVHDVFVLQVHGTKHWIIHPPVLEHPHRDEPWNDRADSVRTAAQGPPLLEAVLAAGDVLYLPRGFVHSARACGGTSLHLTIGIHPWTGRHVASALLETAGESLRSDPRVRANLPAGVDVTDPDGLRDQVDQLRDALLEAIRGLDAEAIVPALAGQALAAQRAAPLPPLAQLAAADALSPDACVRLRRHLQLHLAPGPSGAVATGRAGTIRLDAAEATVLDQLLDGQLRTVADLPGTPLAAVAALVRHGLVEVLG
ncbi:Cupin superfamily protein [Raineyella antarctica]|uniref:Cupin superfamily protein n=1 Tax=Raineyella antarctica TaxID=1577474 RepID=A0A1G6GY87_9ACTN|nr:cupin domain-containing protein [Raineyella antarctica]SDB86949.1 Cupin superfamily protein [Raineyella antarctica]